MKDLVSPSEKHINLGMIMVTLENVRKHSYEINISNINLDQSELPVKTCSERFGERKQNNAIREAIIEDIFAPEDEEYDYIL